MRNVAYCHYAASRYWQFDVIRVRESECKKSYRSDYLRRRSTSGLSSIATVDVLCAILRNAVCHRWPHYGLERVSLWPKLTLEDKLPSNVVKNYKERYKTQYKTYTKLPNIIHTQNSHLSSLSPGNGTHSFVWHPSLYQLARQCL